MFNTLRPGRNCHYFADDIFKCIFLNENIWISLKISLKFLSSELTIFQHWFRQWLGADQATSHYLNRCWLVYWRIYPSLGLNELSHSLYPFLEIISRSPRHVCVSWGIVNGCDAGEYGSGFLNTDNYGAIKLQTRLHNGIYRTETVTMFIFITTGSIGSRFEKILLS